LHRIGCSSTVSAISFFLRACSFFPPNPRFSRLLRPSPPRSTLLINAGWPLCPFFSSIFLVDRGYTFTPAYCRTSFPLPRLYGIRRYSGVGLEQYRCALVCRGRRSPTGELCHPGLISLVAFWTLQTSALVSFFRPTLSFFPTVRFLERSPPSFFSGRVSLSASLDSLKPRSRSRSTSGRSLIVRAFPIIQLAPLDSFVLVECNLSLAPPLLCSRWFAAAQQRFSCVEGPGRPPFCFCRFDDCSILCCQSFSFVKDNAVGLGYVLVRAFQIGSYRPHVLFVGFLCPRVFQFR